MALDHGASEQAISHSTSNEYTFAKRVVPWLQAHFAGWKMHTHHTRRDGHNVMNACCQGACPCCRANHCEAVGRCDVCIDMWELSVVSTSFFAAVVENGRSQPRGKPRRCDEPNQTGAMSHNEIRFLHVGGVRIRRIHGNLHDGLYHRKWR